MNKPRTERNKGAEDQPQESISRSESKRVLDADLAAILQQAGTRPPWLAIRFAKGCHLIDIAGNSYLDLHGNNCHHIGYAHPRLVAALSAQLNELTFVPRGLTNEQVVLAAERLSNKWPYGPSKVCFAPGGSAAVEIALMICRAHTGRYKTVSFYDAYHGRSAGALSLGGRPRDRSPRLGPLLPGALHVPPFYPLPGARGHAATADGAAELSLSALALCLKQEGDVAGIFAEPIRNGGFRPPDWYWTEVRELCDRHGVLLVADEIPTGLGKTGRWFATQHLNVRPDITVVGKALGGTAIPVAAVILSSNLDTTSDLNLGYFTYERSPLMARAVSAVLEIIEDEDLVKKSESLGIIAERCLKGLASRQPAIKEIRPAGLMLGVSIESSDRDPDGSVLARSIFLECLGAGVFVHPPYINQLQLSFPLVIEGSDLVQAFDKIEQAIKRAVAHG